MITPSSQTQATCKKRKGRKGTVPHAEASPCMSGALGELQAQIAKRLKTGEMQ